MHAAVAEVPVGDALQPVLVEQRLEGTQVAAQALHGDGGVLPAGMGGMTVAGPGREPRAVLPDPPQRRRLGRLGDHEGVQGGGVCQHPPCLVDDLGHAVPGQLDHQPGIALGQLRDDGGGHVAQPLDDARVQPLDGGGGVGEQARRGIGGVGDRRVAEDHQPAVRRVGDQPHGRTEDHRQGALAADEGAGHVEAALGQQVLERVARDLPAEPAQLRADRGQFPLDQAVQLAEDAGARARAAAEPQPFAGPGDDVEADHIVRRPAVAQRSRATGVVADHPADRAAVVRARVGAEPQAGGLRRGLQRRLDQARLDHRRAGFGIDAQHPVQVAAGVEDDARTDRVARDGGPRAACGQRDAEGAAHLQRRDDLVGVPRADDRPWEHAVERGVGGVQGAGQPGPVDVGDARAAQSGQQVVVGHRGAAHHSSIERR